MMLDQFFSIPAQGDFDVRFLPPKHGGKLFAALRYHRTDSAQVFSPTGGGGTKVHQCHRTLQDGKWQGWCEYCDVYAVCVRSYQNGDMDYRHMASMIKPYERYYYNIIVREHHHRKLPMAIQDDGPFIWGLGKTLHTKVIEYIVGKEIGLDKFTKPGGDVTDRLKGRDFRVCRTFNHAGGIHYPIYDDSHFLEPSKAGDKKKWDKWIENLHDLSSLHKLEDQAVVSANCKAFMSVEMPVKPSKRRVLRSIDDEFDV
jgi:hypothetical protein